MLTVGVIGATVMPHAVCLHSGLTHNRIKPRNDQEKQRIFRCNTKEVIIAMSLAGLINLSMMFMAASAFHANGHTGIADIPSVCKTLTPLLGSAVASAFLISLLASGISSSAVGTMAGQVIMQGFVGFSIPLWVRRVVTMLPTFIIVALGNQKIEETVDANKDYFHLWKHHVLFTWQWWIQLALAIIPIVVWILLRKRESTGRLLYVGFFILLVASWMDFVGNSFGLWYYPYKLVPTLTPPLLQ